MVVVMASRPKMRENKGMLFLSQSLEIDLDMMDMSTKLYLDSWNYNDGCCYMVLEVVPASQQNFRFLDLFLIR